MANRDRSTDAHYTKPTLIRLKARRAEPGYSAALSRGERVMPHYRLYALSAERIVSAVDLECSDDAAAVRASLEHHQGFAKELWCGKRLVLQISHPPPSPEEF